MNPLNVQNPVLTMWKGHPNEMEERSLVPCWARAALASGCGRLGRCQGGQTSRWHTNLDMCPQTRSHNRKQQRPAQSPAGDMSPTLILPLHHATLSVADRTLNSHPEEEGAKQNFDASIKTVAWKIKGTACFCVPSVIICVAVEQLCPLVLPQHLLHLLRWMDPYTGQASVGSVLRAGVRASSFGSCSHGCRPWDGYPVGISLPGTMNDSTM